MCNTTVRKVMIGGRGTLLCPKCQILKEGRKNDIFFLFFKIISIFIADMVKWLWLFERRE